MGRLEDIGDADGWRCWICDQPVDPAMSVNDARGASVDSISTEKNRSKAPPERLAHRACNTRKGAVAAVIPWSPDLFVIDPAPILMSVDRLQRKRGREAMARCPSQSDADDAAAWLLDRIGRLRPGHTMTTEVERVGGQYLVVLRA